MYRVRNIRNCPRLLNLLETSSASRTFNSKLLAVALGRSTHTIDNEWAAICEYYGVSSREEAYWKAVDDGVVEPMQRRPPEASSASDSPPDK